MTIAKRILLLVFSALIGLVAIGTFSVMKMRTVNDKLEYANNKTIPALRNVEAIGASLLQVRIMFVTLNFVAPDEQKPAVQKSYIQAREDLSRRLKEYESLLLNDKDREYLETSKRIVTEYFALLEISSAAIQARDMEKAKALSAVGRELTSRLAENIAGHSKYHADLAAEEAKQGAGVYRQGIIESLLIVAAVTLIIGVIGFITQRHVAGALTVMNIAFDRVASNLDFTARLPAYGNDELSRTNTAFNHLLERMQQSLRDILSKTDAVNRASENVASAANQMSITSRRQSEAASDMAATMEEMTVSISHVADRAGDADELSRTSGQRARQGTEIIANTVSEINAIALAVDDASRHISGLEQNSNRINSVLSVIKEVADQTNLLALNAAIEAARAGEQGRGFAVVADEVRKLAERTTQSTLEISVTINEMQAGARQAVEGIKSVVAKTSSGVNQAEKANQAILEIGDSSIEAVEMVGEISVAIREQSEASTSISKQVERIALMAEKNSTVSHATSTTASDLARLVEEMQTVVGQYKV